MKVICAPSSVLPKKKPEQELLFAMYEQAPNSVTGSTGASVLHRLQQRKLPVEPVAWDLMTLALAVTAADEAVLRSSSPDGWTREIELCVALRAPQLLEPQRSKLESLLSFLTGDVWRLTFADGGIAAPYGLPINRVPADKVALLSGGADSLVGGVDQFAAGNSIFFVSQVSAGDKKTQQQFASVLSPKTSLLQLNHVVSPAGISERSQRARSFAFLAYGVIAATSLTKYQNSIPVDLLIPENGFISLNVPLTPLRLGSLSTRTTHPIYIAGLQRILDDLGLSIRLTNPYQFQTKGEMMAACADQALLKQLVFDSTSCGRFARNKFQHCGRCVPCLIRRAAILAWGEKDKTSYRYANLAKLDREHREFDDVRSALMAVDYVRRFGIDRWTIGAIDSNQLSEVEKYQAIARRGLAELAAFLCPKGKC